MDVTERKRKNIRLTVFNQWTNEGFDRGYQLSYNEGFHGIRHWMKVWNHAKKHSGLECRVSTDFMSETRYAFHHYWIGSDVVMTLLVY